jgi:hypothetical protein
VAGVEIGEIAIVVAIGRARSVDQDHRGERPLPGRQQQGAAQDGAGAGEGDLPLAIGDGRQRRAAQPERIAATDAGDIAAQFVAVDPALEAKQAIVRGQGEGDPVAIDPDVAQCLAEQAAAGKAHRSGTAARTRTEIDEDAGFPLLVADAADPVARNLRWTRRAAEQQREQNQQGRAHQAVQRKPAKRR